MLFFYNLIVVLLKIRRVVQGRVIELEILQFLSVVAPINAYATNQRKKYANKYEDEREAEDDFLRVRVIFHDAEDVGPRSLFLSVDLILNIFLNVIIPPLLGAMEVEDVLDVALQFRFPLKFVRVCIFLLMLEFLIILLRRLLLLILDYGRVRRDLHDRLVFWMV